MHASRLRAPLLLLALLAAGCRGPGDGPGSEVLETEARAQTDPLRPARQPATGTPLQVARAAQVTHEVVSALMAETALNSNHVLVETDEAARAVRLRGAVPSTGQRELAERLARDRAPGYALVNELRVEP